MKATSRLIPGQFLQALFLKCVVHSEVGINIKFWKVTKDKSLLTAIAFIILEVSWIPLTQNLKVGLPCLALRVLLGSSWLLDEGLPS